MFLSTFHRDFITDLYLCKIVMLMITSETPQKQGRRLYLLEKSCVERSFILKLWSSVTFAELFQLCNTWQKCGLGLIND